MLRSSAMRGLHSVRMRPDIAVPSELTRSSASSVVLCSTRLRPAPYFRSRSFPGFPMVAARWASTLAQPGMSKQSAPMLPPRATPRRRCAFRRPWPLAKSSGEPVESWDSASGMRRSAPRRRTAALRNGWCGRRELAKVQVWEGRWIAGSFEGCPKSEVMSLGTLCRNGPPDCCESPKSASSHIGARGANVCPPKSCTPIQARHGPALPCPPIDPEALPLPRSRSRSSFSNRADAAVDHSGSAIGST